MDRWTTECRMDGQMDMKTSNVDGKTDILKRYNREEKEEAGGGGGGLGWEGEVEWGVWHNNTSYFQ